MNNAQVVSVAFRQGIDERVDPKQAPPGTLTGLRNGVFTRQGEIAKRYGTLRLSEYDPALNLVSIARLFTRGDELCGVATDGYVYTYSEHLSRWIKHDLAPEWTATWSTAVDSSVGVCDPDIATYNGMAVVTWRSGIFSSVSGELYIAAYDLTTGATLINPTLVTSTAAKPHVIAESGVFIVGWQDLSVTPRKIRVCTVDPTTQTISAITDLLTDVAVGQNLVHTGFYGSVTYAEPSGWDMAGMGDGTVALVYARSAGAPWLRVVRFYTNFVPISAAAHTLYAAAQRPLTVSCAIWPGTTTLYIGFGNYASIATMDYRLAGFDMGGMVSLWDVGPGVGQSDMTPVSVCAIDASNAVYNYNRTSARVTSGGSVSSGLAVDGFPQSRQWVSGSRLYVGINAGQKFNLWTATPPSISNPSVMVAELPLSAYGVDAPAFPAAVVAPRMGTRRSLHASNVGQVSASDVWFPFSFARELGEQAQLPAMGLARMQKNDAQRTRAVNILGLAIVCGAVPWWFDGSTVGDVGFVGSIPTATSSATVGGLVASTTYLVGVVAQRRDRVGNLHRGPAYLTSVTLNAGNTSLDVTQRYYSVTSKQKAPGVFAGVHLADQLVVYLSASNGQILSRAASITNLATSGSATANLGSGSFGELLYTTGNRLEDQQAPGFVAMVAHKNRIFGISGDQRTVYFSKQTTDDASTFPGFNDALTFRIDDIGNLVALASHDSVLLVLGDDGVHYVEGDGPAPVVGASSDLSPRRINTTIGCADARSVVTYQDGTMYLGTDGRLYLVQRDLSVVPFGFPIEDTLAAYPVVTSAVAIEDQDQVRLTCNNAAGSAGVVLVWDYVARTWSRFDYWDTSGAGPNAPITSAVMWRGQYVFSFASGYVFKEDQTRYTDVDAWVTLQIETAWMSTTGPQGWQRVRRVQTLGDYRTAHGLTIEQAVDYSTTYQQTTTFAEANVAVNRAKVTVGLGAQNGMNPRCQAYRLRITDTAPAVSGTGEASRWSGFALEVIPRTGVARQGAASRKA